MKTLEERFWEKVRKTETCWIWTAAKNSAGYGQIRTGGKRGPVLYAHRLAVQFATGREIPRGMAVDHICHTRICVRPDHLRVVTPGQNSQNLGPILRSNNHSGARSVHWCQEKKKWAVQVGLNYQRHWGGYFADLKEAEQAAIALRNKLYTHNDLDRRSA